MTSNPESMVPQLPHEFQNLLASVTGPDAHPQTADTVERTLFRRLLALGAALLRLFLVTRAVVRPAAPVPAPDDTGLTYHDLRPTTSDSVFGNVRFARHAFTAPGQPGRCPLDAELSLPARCDSDLRQEWAVYGAPDESYRESQTVLERMLGLSLGVHALETCVTEAGEDVPTFYEQPAAPTAPVHSGTILVVQADAKGVPMVQPPTPRLPVRLGKGQKRGKKREAVVTGLYTITPYPRPAQEGVAALLQEPGGSEPTARPRPEGKELRATLAGKAVAMHRLAQRGAPREGPAIQECVALTDGAEALPQQLVHHFPAHTLGLDIIHATESLWDTATALRGETQPQRTAWVRAYLESLLAGETDAVITALEAEAKNPRCTRLQRQAVRRTVGYDQRNRPYMHDDEYLARGWPIGRGIVEGACRHLVKDRLEHSGMRWTPDGAQAVLDLRAVRRNGHWEAYWTFHRQQQQRRLSGASSATPEHVEAQALEMAA